jgi:hypothetical protein
MDFFKEIGKVASDVGTAAANVVSDVGAAVGGAATSVAGAAADVGTAAANVASDVGGAVTGVAGDVGAAVEGAASTVVGAVGSGVGTVVEAVKSAPGEIIGGVIGTILLGPAGGIIGGALGGAIEEAPAAEFVATVAPEAAEEVKDEVKEAVPEIHLAREIEELVKGMRGLADDAKRKRRGSIMIERGSSDPNAKVALIPGQDAPITVAVPALRRNANVHRITATLLVADAESVPPSEPTVATVDSTASEEKDTVSVTVATPLRPRNVVLKLDGGTPFWTHATALTDRAYPLPDFSAAVNDFLDRADLPDDLVSLRFLVRSDTPGLVGIVIDPASVDATLIKLEQWTNAIDRTIHLDRALTVDFAGVEEIPLGVVDAPPTGRVALLGVAVDVSGTVGAERLLGDVPASETTEFATINAEYAVAQATAPGAALQCVGVSALLAADGTAPARVYIELQADEHGTPMTSPPLARAEVALPPSPTGVATWVYVPFDRPGALIADKIYWVVVRGIQGSARLALEVASGAFATGVVMNRGGQHWRAVTPRAAAAMLRLVYLPGPETASSAVEIQVARAQGPGDNAAPLVRRRVDARPAVQNVVLSLEPALALTPLKLVVRSHARGTVRLANVSQEYTVTST